MTRITAALGAVLALSLVHPVPTAAATQSFSTHDGVMDVDYARYLSQHDVVFNRPITNPRYGSTVGNGRVGAMVWNTNGLTMQVSGIDASEETCFSAGLANLTTSPAMDTGYARFQQRLSLYDGLLTTRYDSDRVVTVMGSPDSEVIGIHVDDRRAGVKGVTFDLSLWDVSSLSGGDVPDMQTWRTVQTYANQDGPELPSGAGGAGWVGLSRGQTDPNDFGYTLAATVEGAPFTTEATGQNKVRLDITPGASYTIWIACASRLNAPGHDSVAQARRLLGGVRRAGYARTLAAYKNWWHGFWRKSFVQYSGLSGDADYLENMYYLYMYMIGAGAYGSYPFHFIDGDYSGVEDDTSHKWSVAYWFWNQRDVYDAFLASNHIDAFEGFNRLYSRNFDALKAYTKAKYGIDGIWVPETMGWDGNARHTDDSDYTKNIYSTGTEAAENMYLQYAYTNDTDYLRTTAYPFMKEVAKFYAARLTHDDATGKYVMAMSNAHETYWGVRNAITDLAAVRSLFPLVIKTSRQLGVDAELCARWQSILDNLAPYPVAADGSTYSPHDPPDVRQSNGENIVCELLWPYGVTGIGAADYEKMVTAWNARPNPYSNVWSPDAIQAARLGLGDRAFEGMKGMLEMYQTYPNGRTDNTNGEFEYCGVHLLATNESLMQSYDGKIRVFPAVPTDPSFVGRFTLLATGGFLVSSERNSAGIKYVGVKSLYGNAATVENPWTGQQVDVRRMSDGVIISTTSAPEIRFSTSANTVYVVERTTKPFSTYAHMRLTGTANGDARMLDGTSVTLGSFAGTRPDTGKYEAEDASLTSDQVSADFSASNGREVTNMALGSAITFSGVRAGNRIAVRYCTFNDPGKLGLYINGTRVEDVVFPATKSWWTTYATQTVDVSVPKGASVALRYDDGDSGVNIDYIRVENVPAGPAGTLPGTLSDFHGYASHDFTVDGCAVHVVDPKDGLPGRPWVWRTMFWDAFPTADIALLARGFSVAFIDVGDTFGCPDAMKHFDAFYAEMTTRYGFAKRPALEGLSRGGLYAYRWAYVNTDKIGCIYGDAPLCDMKSWPEGRGKSTRMESEVQAAIQSYHFRDESEMIAFAGNPIDILQSIAQARIPIIHVCGDADRDAPMDENNDIVQVRYEKLGGPFTLIVKQGCAHHPHGLTDPTPVVDFIVAHCATGQAAMDALKVAPKPGDVIVLPQGKW